MVDDRRAEVCGQRKQANDPCSNQHSPGTPTTGLQERGNDTSRSTGRSGRQNAACDPTQHAKGRTGDCPGPRKETTTRRNVTQGGGGSGAVSSYAPVRLVQVGAGAVVGGSAQLWMADIHRLDVSVYAVPFGRWVSWFTPGAPQPPLPERRAAMPFLADQTVFDYVIGNDDRNTNKNNYVAGGCKWTCLRAGPEPQHLGPPTFVHLDHGKAFYKTGDPDFVALSAKNNTFCKYGNRTYQALRGYDGAWGAFERDLRARVRPGIYSYIPARHYRAAHARLEKWLKHVRACEAAYGHDAVFPWP